MQTIKDLITSRAIMTAFIAVIGAVVSYYVNIPAEIWAPIISLLGVIVLKFTFDDFGLMIGRTIVRGLQEGFKDK